MSQRIFVVTLIAMFAFAANSVLCRLALGPGLIDAASFATVRLISGATMLTLIVLPRWRVCGRASADWRSAAMLFIYMAFFSFAYLSLSTGTGALILFGAVQLTMFMVALRAGEHFPMFSWIGFLLAIIGLVYLVYLVYLVSPGVTSPDPLGAVLMAIAGIAWGVYWLLGRHASDPLEATANNFIFAVPLGLVVSFVFREAFHISLAGLILAPASGAIASGLGYVVWFEALPGLTATRAATVLSSPCP